MFKKITRLFLCPSLQNNITFTMDHTLPPYKILKEQDFKLSTWSGGTTKQLYIHPQTANYAQRNFTFRISIATTQNETSTFTKLQNVSRVISILQGKMQIDHKDHHNRTLLPYDIDRFQGSWQTTSKGKVTDFNLMVKNCEGDFCFKEILAQEMFKMQGQNGMRFVYCISGNLSLFNEQVKTNELIILNISKAEMKANQQTKIFYGYIKI